MYYEVCSDEQHDDGYDDVHARLHVHVPSCSKIRLVLCSLPITADPNSKPYPQRPEDNESSGLCFFFCCKKIIFGGKAIMIEIEHLNKTYPSPTGDIHALRDVDLRIQRRSACTWNVLRKNRAGRANQSKECKMYGTGSRTA